MNDDTPPKRPLRFSRPLLAGAVAAAVAAPAHAALVMTVDGLTGESTVTGYKDRIDLVSVSHGVSRTVGLGGRDTQSSRLSCGPIEIGRQSDSATPKLFRLALEGTTSSKVEIVEVRTINSKDVVVSKLELDNTRLDLAARNMSDNTATESYSLQMARWRLVVQRFDTLGAPVGSPETTGFDCVGGKVL